MSKIRFQGNASGTGTLTVASPNTNSDFTLNLPASGGTVLVDGATQSPTFNAVTATSVATTSATTTTLAVAGNNISAVNSLGFRNRIINGDMRIDQRNAGASVGTGSGTFIYTVDRWQAIYAATSKYTIQQNAGSVTPPATFTNYLGVTSSSAYTPGAAEYFSVRQMIEGFNTADFDWGTANAKTVTLSFWVRSSLTGTFGGAIVNGASAGGENRSYPFSYSVSSANTWTQISLTIPGDTTGTWSTGNTGGVQIRFGLGAGSSFLGTSGSWQAGNFIQPTGTVSVVGTNGATFYITGVQLEAGSVATPFERRDYGRELMMCQRYFWKIGGSTNSYQIRGSGIEGGAISQTLTFPVAMRASPTVTIGSVIYANGSGLAFNTNVQQATMGFNTTASGVDCYVTASGTGFTTFSSEL